MKTLTTSIVAMLIAAIALPVAAQLRPPHARAELDVVAASPQESAAGAPDQDVEHQQSSLAPDDPWKRNAALIAGGALLVGTYGMNKWWEDGFTGGFRSHNEGWFGQDTSSGGADKLGHAYTVYAGARLMARGFEAAGNQPRKALKLGVWSALGIMTAIEAVDGYSKRYRFSAQDAVMNLAGAGIGYLAETYPDLDRLIDFRLLYRRSGGSTYDPAGDYSGQTYLLVLKASGVPALREREPLRYLEFAVGYGTHGYKDPPGFERSRNVYVGVSLNLSELFGQTVFRGSSQHSRAHRATDQFLEFIQVPGTAALARNRL